MEYQLKQRKVKATQFKEGMKKPIPGTSLTVGGRTVLRAPNSKCVLSDGDYVTEHGSVQSAEVFESIWTPVRAKKVAPKKDPKK